MTKAQIIARRTKERDAARAEVDRLTAQVADLQSRSAAVEAIPGVMYVPKVLLDKAQEERWETVASCIGAIRERDDLRQQVSSLQAELHAARQR